MAGPRSIGLISTRLRDQAEKELAMSYPARPGTAESSIFDRIARMEQLVNYYSDKTSPARATNSFSDSKACLEA